MSAFKVRFWGTRGSIPAPGAKTQRYGGNTSCVELRHARGVFILDAGTGIRELGDQLVAESMGRPVRAHLFITHTPWDHVQGFPFFFPIYAKENGFWIYGPRGIGKGFEENFRGLMDFDYFPVGLSDVSAELRFKELQAEPFEIEGVAVRAAYTNHPGMDLAYRFSLGGRSVTYLTDHEPYQTMNGVSELTRRQDRAIEDFCRGSDLLICDGQYTERQYRARKGWGHSRYTDTVQLAVSAGVLRLAISHHDPSHTDEQLDAIAEDCRRILKRSGSSMDCIMAGDGLDVEI
ncbi:MAG: MBL fold metallo-hydrolase [Elusimicrobia bacterium]|nr:MBL fold metallo-hydrolase [Elusimicrobiota bacterium]